MKVIFGTDYEINEELAQDNMNKCIFSLLEVLKGIKLVQLFGF